MLMLTLCENSSLPPPFRIMQDLYYAALERIHQLENQLSMAYDTIREQEVTIRLLKERADSADSHRVHIP